MIEDKYQISASLLNCEPCCDTKRGMTFDRIYLKNEDVIECSNCGVKINSSNVPFDKDLFEAWDEMIIERDRQKRDILSVDVNLYPYAYAMI